MMVKLSDIAGYTYRADNYCPDCIKGIAISGIEGMGYFVVDPDEKSFMAFLSEWADLARIDPEDEYAYDSDDFPKVIFHSDAEDATCGGCHESL